MSEYTAGPQHLREDNFNWTASDRVHHFQTKMRPEDAQINMWFVKDMVTLIEKRPVDPTANHGGLLPLACGIVPRWFSPIMTESHWFT